jgi:tetratricopeptide (TPR) repeat protein
VRLSFQTLLLLLVGMGASAQTSTSSEIQAHMAAGQQAQSARDLATAETEYQAVVSLAPTFAEARMNLGLVHQLQGRDADAIADFRAALKLKPTLTGANFFLGVDLCKLGDGKAALPYLNAAVAQQPDHVEMLGWLATAQDLSEQWAAEAATLNRALKIQPQNIDVLYLLGQAYGHLGQQQAARLKKAAPDSVRAEQLVAESYSATNEWPSAVIHFENAIAKSQRLPGLHVELGEVYLHAGRLKAAATEFEKEFEVDPNGLRSLVRRGETRLLQGDTHGGLDDWQHALDIDPAQVKRILGLEEATTPEGTFVLLPESIRAQIETLEKELKDEQGSAVEMARAFVRVQRGEQGQINEVTARAPSARSCSHSSLEQLLKKQRYSELSACMSQIVSAQISPAQRIEIAGGLLEAGEYDASLRVLDSLPVPQKQTPDALYWRTRCYENLATSAFLRLYKADPNSFRVHQLEGDLAATRNDDGKAVEEYREALRLNGNVPNLHFSLGHILWKILKIPEARVELEAELEFNPHHAGALHDLGDSYLQEHEPEKALPYLQQAVAAYPQNPDIHRDLGAAYAQLKDFVKAEAEYKVGLSNDEDGSVHYKLAKVYQALGRKQDADREFAIYTAMNRDSHEKLEKRGQRLADIERTTE